MVGGGGHCRALIDVAESVGYTILGILDVPEEVGKEVLSSKVIGTDDDIPSYVDSGEFLIAVGFIIFHMFYVETYKDAVIALGQNFVRQNYSECITAMSNIPVERMTTTQQYMLALSYVRSENISKEQKENVLATLSENDTPTRLTYWIHLGRWETEEALDNAMQLSDGQLQIYAYLKEKMHVEGDTSLSGSEKQERIDEIEKQIEVLERQYNIKVDEDE